MNDKGLNGDNVLFSAVGSFHASWKAFGNLLIDWEDSCSLGEPGWKVFCGKIAASPLVIDSGPWWARGLSHSPPLAQGLVSLAAALSSAFLQLRITEGCAGPELGAHWAIKLLLSPSYSVCQAHEGMEADTRTGKLAQHFKVQRASS